MRFSRSHALNYVSQLPYIDDGNIKVNGHRKDPSLMHARANVLQSVLYANGEQIFMIMNSMKFTTKERLQTNPSED